MLIHLVSPCRCVRLLMRHWLPLHSYRCQEFTQLASSEDGEAVDLLVVDSLSSTHAGLGAAPYTNAVRVLVSFGDAPGGPFEPDFIVTPGAQGPAEVLAEAVMAAEAQCEAESAGGVPAPRPVHAGRARALSGT